MKTIVSILAVLLAVGGVYIFLNQDSQQKGVFEGEVITVDLEPVTYDGPAMVTALNSSGEEAVIAVPSMGLPLCVAFENIASPFDIAVGDKVSVNGAVNDEGQIVPCESEEHYLEVVEVHTASEVGLEFEYRIAPEGYVLQEHEGDVYADPSFVKVFTLMLEDDFEFFSTNTEASEGPPSIGIAVFRNTLRQSASVWVDANPSLSNIGLLSGEVNRDVVVGGANAVRYMIDGLYMTDTIAVAHGDFIYHISGAFLEENSLIRNDFKQLVASLSFVPVSE